MTTAPILLTLVLATVPTAAELGPGASPAAAPRGPAILDFHADWCPPCKEMRPRLELLAKKNYPVRSIDVEEHPELAERFKVVDVPTFVIVDADGREVARRKGIVEARELAELLRRAIGPTPVTADSPRPKVRPASDSIGGRINPDPWATVVRIQVKDRGTLGYGSGTVIDSTPEESIILTCAHIFYMKGRQQPKADQFHKIYPVQVELFDGKLGGPGGQTVRPLGLPMPGEVIDYDFDRDVALVRIRPGRVVPSTRVVPPHWEPRARMAMYTVGCSHGEDATAWNTVILNPASRFQVPGKRNYKAIECDESPKQGRSGGGLFTDDGHVAGVCNFAFDRSVGRGLYASPESIYAILDRNGRSDLYEYQPSRGPQLFVADQDAPPADRTASEDVVLRGQSPDGEAVADAGGRVLNVEPIVVPRPEFLGIQLPEATPGAMPIPASRDAAAAMPAVGRGDRPGRSAWIPVGPGGPTAGRADGGSVGRASNRPASGSTADPSSAGRDWRGRPIGGQ